MKNNGKILLAGPWIGEFGWELFCWQGYVRKLSKNYDKTIVISRPGNSALYEDFCDEYIEFDPKSFETDSWMCKNSVNYDKLLISIEHTDYFSGNFDIGYRCLTDGTSLDTKNIFNEQDFVKYTTSTNFNGYDILFHCRNKSTGSQRNWDINQWVELKKQLPDNLKIACIGNSESFLIDGCDDLRSIDLIDLIGVMNKSSLIVGPSSGPMHLASLCGLKHLVWSSEHNRIRYFKDWNPHNTKVIFYSKDNWNPKPIDISNIIISELKIKLSNKYIFAITSYNRYNKLINILNQIKNETNQPTIVFNDGSSDIKYNKLINNYSDITLINNPHNNGKGFFNKTITDLLLNALNLDGEYIILLPDDFILCENFITILDKLVDEKKIINLFSTEGPLWGNTAWIDGAFVASKDAIKEVIKFIPSKLNNTNKENKSTGVWSSVTSKLNNQTNYEVFNLNYSLTQHDGNEDSKLHPSFRLKNPAIANNFYDDYKPNEIVFIKNTKILKKKSSGGTSNGDKIVVNEVKIQEIPKPTQVIINTPITIKKPNIKKEGTPEKMQKQKIMNKTHDTLFMGKSMKKKLRFGRK